MNRSGINRLLQNSRFRPAVLPTVALLLLAAVVLGAQNEIYEGTLGVWDSHRRLDCSDAGGDLQEDIEPGTGNRYYFVVPRGGGYEGSYGTDSDGNERPVGFATCASSQLLGCP